MGMRRCCRILSFLLVGLLNVLIQGARDQVVRLFTVRAVEMLDLFAVLELDRLPENHQPVSIFFCEFHRLLMAPLVSLHSSVGNGFLTEGTL